MCGEITQTGALSDTPNTLETQLLNPVLTILVQQIQDTFDRRHTDPTRRLGYGNAKLDEMTGGLHEGSLTIIMEPPMSGKTIFVSRLALEVASNPENEVLFYSAEMDAHGRRISMSGKCKFCGSTGYGACSSSPHKKHEHQDDEQHCVYCGATGYGACSNSPSKTHKHGSNANKCVYCGATGTGSCSKSPHGKHEK